MMRTMSIALLVGASCMLLTAQSTRTEDLAAGKILVASQDLADPNFAETVVLLVQFDEDAVVGIIVNRPMKARLGRLSEKLAAAKGHSEPLYEGGPVGKGGVLALVRSSSKLDDAVRIFGDVYLVSSKASLEKSITSSTETSPVHVYLGYAGWTGPQLQQEVEAGAWYIFRGDAELLFDKDPESIWTKLIRKTEQRVAAIRQP